MVHKTGILFNQLKLH